MYNSISIKGAKKKPKQPRKPVIAKDSAASMSFFKGDYGTSEGEIYGLVDGGKSIFLEGTPLLDDDGNPNFEGVTWEERKGTLDQEYMKGFPDVSNEVGIGVELKGGTPWVRSITNTQLSALRLRFKWDRLAKTNPDNGDVTGYRIDYAIDLRTDGGAYQEVLSTKIEDKTSAGYERTHRIDLPKSKTGWSVRVRRITPNADSEYISDKMYIDALAEVIDVKLAYPLTAGIGLQYNAELFNGVAKVEFLKRGRILKVPTNYNAETRAYTGIWDGTFKEAYSNNPAWVYYDLLTNKRYGLGNRLDASMIDKWGIYNLARYCDEMVSDGQGGLEPRFTCNVYLQKQATAYEVLQHIAGIFSALSYWNGEKIFLDADIPRDPVFTFTNANVVGGNFSYSGTRDRDRHNIIKVAWDNPANGFKTEYEYVRDEKSIALNGIKPLDLAAFGCTSQSQAQRLGLRALKTEQLETQQVTFATGLAAINCKVGDVIAISDASLAGKSNGGLISNVNGRVITIDRDAVVNIGDTLTVNTAKGLSERRNVTAVSGRNITVAAAFDGAEREHVWSVESSDLKMQLFRVMSVTENDDATYSVLGIQHEPQKFNAIDFGTDVKPTSVSIVDDIAITPPESVVIKSRHRVEQGQTVATLIIEWSQVKEAVAYEVEWRKDDGSWVRVPRTGTNSVEIDGVYAGQYLARVRSVGAFDSVSNPTTSMLTEVKGKVGKPPKLAHLTATGILFGIELSWSFAQDSKDADYVEIEQGSAPDTNVSLLGQFSYPTDRHEITGLQGGLTRSYRARLVDKLGFKSDWSAWATATVDDSPDKVLDLISGQIKESHLYQTLTGKINQIPQISNQLTEAKNQWSQSVQDIYNDMANIRFEASKKFAPVYSWGFDYDPFAGEDPLNDPYYTLPNMEDFFGHVIKGKPLTHFSGVLDGGYFMWAGSGTKVTENPFLILKWPEEEAITDPEITIDRVQIKLLAFSENPDILPTWQFAETGADAMGGFVLEGGFVEKTLTEPDFGELSPTKAGDPMHRSSPPVYISRPVVIDIEFDSSMLRSGILAILEFGGDVSYNTETGEFSVFRGFVIESIEAGYSTEGNAEIMVLDERRERQEQDGLIRADLMGAYDLINGQSAEIIEIKQVQIDDRSTTATAIEELKVVNQNQSALILSSAQASIGRDNAIGERIDTIQAEFDDNLATHQQQLTTNANAISAEVKARETLQVTVNGQKTSIQTLQSVTSKYGAQYSVKLDNNGRATGFGLINQTGQPTEFAIVAEKFYIAGQNTTGKGVAPFQVLTSPALIDGTLVPAGTYIRNAHIANGAITTAKIGTAQVDTLRIKGNAVTVPRLIHLADPALDQVLPYGSNRTYSVELATVSLGISEGHISIRTVIDWVSVLADHGSSLGRMELIVKQNNTVVASRPVITLAMWNVEQRRESIVPPEVLIVPKTSKDIIKIELKFNYSGTPKITVGEMSVAVTGVQR